MNRYKMIASDPTKLQYFIKRNRKELSCWALLVVAIIVIYFAFSDGDFSFFLTLSGLVQMFGFLLIAIKVKSSQSVSGLSLNTQICYAVSFVAKICSIMKYEAYLPFDKSGDYVYRVGECLSLTLSLYVIYMAAKKYRSTYNGDVDRVNAILLIIPMFILGALIHPGLNNSYFADIAWAFSLYLETLAMFPQLYMFFKRGGEVEAFNSHFVASQGLSRCFTLVFWIFSYHELNQHPGKIWSLLKGNVGYFVMLFQVLHLLLFSDFLYEYIKSMRRGLPMTVRSVLV